MQKNAAAIEDADKRVTALKRVSGARMEPRISWKKRLFGLGELSREIIVCTWLQDNIDVVSSDFNERLREEFPDLSKSEIELLSLIKLKLSNKQIAIHKNTSPNTINVALHRLKTKCEFETTNELKSYIEEF